MKYSDYIVVSDSFSWWSGKVGFLFGQWFITSVHVQVRSLWRIAAQESSVETIWLNKLVPGFAKPHSVFSGLKDLNERCYGKQEKCKSRFCG